MTTGRSVSARATLLLSLAYMPICSFHLFAQNTPDPFQINDTIWANTAAPMTDREVGTPAESDWARDLSTPAFDPPPQPVMVGGAQTISVDELRHPLSRKGQKLIEKAERDLRAGEQPMAMEDLNLALKDRSAAPYAHNILGVEYLKTRQVPEAVEELAQATALLPGFAAGHSNFGYALCLNGQSERGLEELETALNLDRSFLKAHFLKGVILMERGTSDHEAWKNLEEAQREIPAAHLALAIFYASHGQEVPAKQQLQDFTHLNPGLTLADAQEWLSTVARAEVPAGVALGLWRVSRVND